MACTEFPRQLFGEVSSSGQPKAALRVDSVPLGTPPGGRIKAFVMADVSQHLRVQAKLKELIERASSDAAVALIRTLFLQHNVVCYVLTPAAVSEGKQYVLFSAEDESGPMVVGQREIIMQLAPHLGPLEIIESNFAEGRFVGLLPHQATHGMQ
jgi:hypothetical protein